MDKFYDKHNIRIFYINKSQKLTEFFYQQNYPNDCKISQCYTTRKFSK